MARLADHLARRGLTGADSTELVFTAPQGGPLDYAHFRRRVWDPATVKAGVDGLEFHDLRRANATALVLEHVDLKTAQTRLGTPIRGSLWRSTRRRRPPPTKPRRSRSGRGS